MFHGDLRRLLCREWLGEVAEFGLALVPKVVPGLALELQKTNLSAYYDTLEPVPQVLTTAVNLMNEHPTLARMFFGGGLLIELSLFWRSWEDAGRSSTDWPSS